MYYYEVAPASKNYVGRKLLTYSSEIKLPLGQIIVVNVRTDIVLAVVISESEKPAFAAKPITKVHQNLIMTEPQMKLFSWLLNYYAGSVGSTISIFMPKIISKLNSDKATEVITSTKKSEPLNLTPDQTSSITNIYESKITTHILHGDTGSGKTQVYIELAKKIIAQNKSTLILTPEISLTPQLLEQFNRHFRNVTVLHSGLTNKQRGDLWQRLCINNAKPRLIIGPRSVLFQPINNLGLIVLDEFQDSSYKQDQNPRYNASQSAAYLAKISGAKLVLGSATPPIEEYYYAKNKGALVHRMTDKPLSSKSRTAVKLVDLSDKNEYSLYPLISKTLISTINNHLNNKRQILIYINRRGTSRLVVCQKCGWSVDCKRCNIPYVYHHDKNILSCHVCSSKLTMPSSCPDCGSYDLLLKKPGTKGIFENMSKIFPEAKIGRYDKDNKKSEKFFTNQKAIAEGNVDILIGTQLLAKGHDLPNLGLVVILMAEESLNFPDYKAHEKSFILMHQLAGRVGRREHDGEIIMQTFNANSSLLEYLNNSSKAWINFYDNELKQRQKYSYPPFSFILKIKISRKTENSALKFTQKIYDMINNLGLKNLEILGPAPAFSNMQNGTHIWQLVVKSKQRSDLLKVIDKLPNSCTYNIDPDDLL